MTLPQQPIVKQSRLRERGLTQDRGESDKRVHSPTTVQSQKTTKGNSMPKAVVAVVAVACSRLASAEGGTTFNAKCEACHGEGSGSKIVARPIAGLPAADVKKAITEGVGKKPVAIDNAAEVAAYVSELKAPGGHDRHDHAGHEHVH